MSDKLFTALVLGAFAGASYADGAVFQCGICLGASGILMMQIIQARMEKLSSSRSDEAHG